MGKRNFYFIKKIIEEILNIIFPPKHGCIVCADKDYIGLCLKCYSSIKGNKNEENYICYGYYGGALKKLILEFKYKSNFLAGDILSDFLIEMIEENHIEFDLISFVPLSRKKKRIRGFNQSEYIAKKISIYFNKPYKIILTKNSENKEQKKLGIRERKDNVKGVYSLVDKKYSNEYNILLIDDVITTGATIDQCEEILKVNGAKDVIKMAIARALI